MYPSSSPPPFALFGLFAWGDIRILLSVRAGTLNLYLSATLKERLRVRGAPIGYGHFPKNWNVLPQFLVFRKSRLWKSWRPKNGKLWQILF